MNKEIKDYVCFDLETTGFGKTAEIIEIGAVKVSDGVTVDKFSELVKPTNRISGNITALTDITQSDVENARTISEVLPDFLNFIGNDVLLGHNIASFDIPIVRRDVAVVLKQTFEPDYIDMMYLAKAVSGVPDNKLQTMLDYYGISNKRAYRAFEDCEATSKMFQAMMRDGIDAFVRKSYAYTSVEEYRPVEQKEDIDVRIEEQRLVSLSGLHIVLTGDFEYGSKEDVAAVLEEHGAQITNSVSRKTDYLIVGSRGSERWKYGNGGSKMKQAAELGTKVIGELSICCLAKEANNV